MIPNQIILGNADAFGKSDININEAEILKISRAEKEENTVRNFIAIYNSIFLHEKMHSLGYTYEDRINCLVRKVNGVLNG